MDGKSFKEIMNSRFLILFCILSCSSTFAAPAEEIKAGTPLAYRDGDVRNSIQTQHFWSNGRFRWPKGQIPYILNSGYSSSDRKIIMDAIAEWEKQTCVRFIPRKSHKDYVEITPKDGSSSYCYSYVGRQGGRQYMKMYGECLRHAAMVHELGHVIGFNHEHQRPDRDDFINVHLENVDPAYHYAFDKFSDREVNNMGTKYDYKSVMHYPFFAFTTYDESKPAMTLKDGSIKAIYREAEHLSPTDISKTKLYYNNCS